MSPGRRSETDTAELRASLVQAALRVVEREGPAGLTTRALAAEAGCAVGLPYKVFADRSDLVGEMIAAEFARIRAEMESIVSAAGSRTVGSNLARWALVLLRTPAIALANEDDPHGRIRAATEAAAGRTGIVPAIESTVVAYLAAEKELGRVARHVDERAFGFLVAGAVHNLLVSGEAYPRPSRRGLERMLASVADALSPRNEKS